MASENFGKSSFHFEIVERSTPKKSAKSVSFAPSKQSFSACWQNSGLNFVGRPPMFFLGSKIVCWSCRIPQF
jgi:hypothetical protein